MVQWQKALSLSVVCFLTVNIMASLILMESPVVDAWEFGGLKVPKTSNEYSVGEFPNSVYVMDVNDDTYPDIITGNWGEEDSITILLGDGSGGFSESVESPILLGSRPLDVFVADVNHDGGPDIVASTSNESDIGLVCVLLNDGNGVFTNATGSPFRVGNGPENVHVADMNNDTHPDIITTNTNYAGTGSDNVSILRGDGTGNFPEMRFVDIEGEDPTGLFVADVNHDTNMDIITSNQHEKDVDVLLGNGDLSFNKGYSRSSSGLWPWDVYVADIDGDSHPDIVIPNNIDNSITVLKGDGEGDFTEMTGEPVKVGNGPSTVCAVDVNGDGRSEIFCANTQSHNVSILFWDPVDEVFHEPSGAYELGQGPSDIVLSDVNGDGEVDIITANAYSDDVSILLGHGYGIFFNGDQNRFNFFEDQQSPFDVDGLPYGIAISDVDVDGYQYIFVTNYNTNPGTVSVLYSTGNGEIKELPSAIEVEGTRPTAVFAIDINQDDFSDLLTVDEERNTVTVHKGLGAGRFSREGIPVIELDAGSDAGMPKSIYVADVNGDSDLDIITANVGTSNVSVFLGDATENFTESPNSPFSVGGEPYGVFVADMDGDDNQDIITANRADDTVTILFGDGSEPFDILDAAILAVGERPFDLFVADLNGDQNPDITTANIGSNNVSLLFGDGAGSFPEQTSVPAGLKPRKVFAEDLGQDGNMDIIVLNQQSDDVSVFNGLGDGVFEEAVSSPYSIISEPRGLFVKDVVGSSLPDIVTTSNTGLKVQIIEVFLDYDFDGVPDEFDAFPTNPTEWEDFDRDLIGNNRDEDDDSDGVPDMIDPFRLNSTARYDLDGDHTADSYDDDIDGDAYDNPVDAFPYNPSEWNDTDSDGIGDNVDDDIDGDNYTNSHDAFEFNPSEWNDTDGDGLGDNQQDDNIDGDEYDNAFDAFPYKGSEWNDTDDDGIGDNTDDDIDGDGYPNDRDRFPYDQDEWDDTDDDKIGDNSDDNIDGDKYDNAFDAFPFSSLEWNDTDGDGIGDNSEFDADNDTYGNAMEEVTGSDPFDRASIPVDTDKDRIPDVLDLDSDNDGYPDERDEFPLDVSEWNDQDNDDIGDNTDPDIDGDGHDNDEDAFPWDPDKWEDEEEFFGKSLGISQYHSWLMRVLFSTILLALYAVLSTGYVVLAKRGIFMSGLFVFQKSRKVPYYKKEIRKANSIPTLNYISDRVEDERDHQNLSSEQYASIREEADKRRIALTYAVLGSLTPEQQLQIFNDMISRDEKFKERLAESALVGEGAEVAATAAGEGAAGTGMAAGKRGGTPDASGKNIDNVHFTVTAPPKVTPKSTFLVDLWAHMEEQLKEVIDQARMMADEEDLTVRSVGPKPIARGTVLTARLRIEEMIIDEAVQTILWEGEIGNANYAVKVPENASLGSKQGTADILIDGLKIAVINFIIKVAEESGAVTQVPVQEKRIETAFASYARLDRDEVLPRIQGIQKAVPSMNIFLDILSLRSGQNWDDEIHKIIPARDIFYLFWSENAQKSHWVEVEWRCALETRGIDFIDPVPLVSPEIVPPPPELSEKHFDDWTLAFMKSEKFKKLEENRGS